MKFIFKINEVIFCMTLRKYHDVTVAENDAELHMHRVHDPIDSYFQIVTI